MNEDYLPDNYKNMYESQTREEYLHNLRTHALFARDHIQRYIDNIRKILIEIPFPSSNKLDEKIKRRIKFLKKKRKEQKNDLNLCEIVIKEDVNKLLNAIAGSVNHKWDDHDLGEIVGFQLDETKCSDDLIPLPIQSLYYVSSLTYGYLIRCAINALNLKCRVIALTQKDSQSIIKAIEESTKKIQQDEKDNQKELKKLIINRNELDEEKTGILSIAECIVIIGGIQKHYYELKIKDYEKIGFPTEMIKEPEEKTIRRYLEFWDQYLNGNKEHGRPPPKTRL